MKVKRYNLEESSDWPEEPLVMERAADGEWVRFEDYQLLHNRLTQALDLMVSLKEELD